MNKLIDFVQKKSEPKNAKDYFQEHSFKVFLWPKAWRNAKNLEQLHWKKVEFGPKTVKDVPKAPSFSLYWCSTLDFRWVFIHFSITFLNIIRITRVIPADDRKSKMRLVI